MPPRHGETILIVGAGMSGLAAARDLVAKGYKVVLLEGRDRVGGRVSVDRSWGIPINVGASWIHGLDGNPITAFAKHLGLRMFPSDYESMHLYLQNGKEISKPERRTVETEYKRRVAAAWKLGEELDQDISLREGLERAGKKASLTPEERRIMEWWYVSEIVLNWAADPEDISLRHGDEDEPFPGKDAILEDYDRIPEMLAEGLDVRFAHEVDKISVRGNGVTVDTRHHGSFEGTRVLVTLPLGILKSKRVRFDPELPDWKKAAIGRLGMGTFNKVLLRFSEAFWPHDREWIGHVGKERDTYPLFVDMLPKTGQPILMCLCGGKASEAIGPMTDDEVREGALAVVKTMYGSDVTTCTNFHATRWHQNLFSLGAYSYPALGSSRKDYDILGEPVGDRLFFAGEHTERKNPGTVHGAYVSGLREAKRIAGL